MRIWLFDDAPILGGAEVFALRLAQFVAERGDLRFRVVCPDGSELARRCAAEGIDFVPAAYPRISPRGAPRWPKAISDIRGLLVEAGPAGIVVGNSPRAQGYLSAAAPLVRPSVRLVHVIHEQETLRRASGRFAFRHVGSLVAMGGNVADLCRELLPGVPVRKANLFLPTDEFDPLPPRKGDPSEKVVGVLTRLIPEKGVLELIEELAAARGWSRALIAGAPQNPAYAARLEERIAADQLNERISLLGHVEDISSFFASIDALVVPSTGTEGQGMTIIEGLAHGRPCLVRRSAWSAEDFDGLPVVPYDGAAELEARLSDLPADPGPLAEAVRRRFGPEQALDAILDAAGPGPSA